MTEQAGTVSEAVAVLLPLLETLDDTGVEPRGTAPSYLRLFAKETASRTDLPADKTIRWLGYIHGVLAARGHHVADGRPCSAAGPDGAVDIHPVADACREATKGLLPLLEGLRDRPSDPEEASPSRLLVLAREAAAPGSLPTPWVSHALGFIQGALVARGDLEMDSERDRTRPIFHGAYGAAGLKIPPTVSIGSGK